MSGPGAHEIALLNFGYWPEIRRGNERLVHDLAGELARRGNEVSIITSHPHRPTRTVEEGVTVVRSWRPPEWPLRVRRFQPNLTHLPFSYLELRRRRPQVAHAFFLSDALAATRWGARGEGRSVYTLTGIPTRANVSNVRGRLRMLEEVTSAADAVLVISEAAREAAWRWLGIEARVIYPGVDLGGFRPGARAAVPTIACAADPGDQRKRVGLLVRAFELVRRERPDAELLLMRPRDPGAAWRLEEVAGVSLLPGDRDVVATMLQNAWASALCSYDEAFGLVLVESLGCGTPVVGARSGAIPEVVDRPEVGRLFDGEDEAALARALLETLELADDPGTERACLGRAADFSIERTAEAHERLYAELLAG